MRMPPQAWMETSHGPLATKMMLIIDEFCCQILAEVYSTQIGSMLAQVIVIIGSLLLLTAGSNSTCLLEYSNLELGGSA